MTDFNPLGKFVTFSDEEFDGRLQHLAKTVDHGLTKAETVSYGATMAIAGLVIAKLAGANLFELLAAILHNIAEAEY